MQFRSRIHCSCRVILCFTQAIPSFKIIYAVCGFVGMTINVEEKCTANRVVERVKEVHLLWIIFSEMTTLRWKCHRLVQNRIDQICGEAKQQKIQCTECAQVLNAKPEFHLCLLLSWNANEIMIKREKRRTKQCYLHTLVSFCSETGDHQYGNRNIVCRCIRFLILNPLDKITSTCTNPSNSVFYFIFAQLWVCSLQFAPESQASQCDQSSLLFSHFARLNHTNAIARLKYNDDALSHQSYR